eukprot:Gb_02868 [translate_table: standard]
MDCKTIRAFPKQLFLHCPSPGHAYSSHNVECHIFPSKSLPPRVRVSLEMNLKEWQGLSTAKSRSSGTPFPCPLKPGDFRLNQPDLNATARGSGFASASASVSAYALSAPNLYDFLSVSPDASMSEIKTAYRRMARQYHPDVCPPADREKCTKMFVNVQEAYETLSDPLLREDYNYRLKNNIAENGSFFGREKQRKGIKRDIWEWRFEWKAQLEELKRRSNSSKLSCSSGTWGSRMRSRCSPE